MLNSHIMYLIMSFINFSNAGSPGAADANPVSSTPAGALASGTHGAESMLTAQGLQDNMGSSPC